MGKENPSPTKGQHVFASVFRTEAFSAGARHASRAMELITGPQSEDRWLNSVLSIPQSLALSITGCLAGVPAAADYPLQPLNVPCLYHSGPTMAVDCTVVNSSLCTEALFSAK